MSNAIDKAGGLQAFLIQAISFVLGSSIILFGVSTFYNDFLNKPDVDIKIIPKSDNFQKASIIVTNNGMKPATDLVLTINTPGNIKEDLTIINTQNLTAMETSTDYIKFNSNLFQLSVPRLVHGNGSMITIDITSETNHSGVDIKKYTVYATYNEGSEFETKYNPPSLQEQLFGQWFDTLTILAYLDTIAGVSIIIFIIPYAHKITHNRKMRRQGRFIFKILDDILSIRNTLQLDIGSNHKIPESWSLVPKDIKWSYIDNVKDYVLLDKFYTAIITHNLKIPNDDVQYIRKVNQECLELAENTLEGIDWKRYRFRNHTVHHKSPLIASVMALLGGTIFLAGIGHIYVEKLRRAIILLILSTIFRILTLITVLTLFDSITFTNNLQTLDNSIASLNAIIGTSAPALLLVIFFSMYIVILFWQIFDARKWAKESNRSRSSDSITTTQKFQ